MDETTPTLAQYEALWQSLRARDRIVPKPQGLDSIVARWGRRVGQWRRGRGRWRALAGRVEALDQQFGALEQSRLEGKLARWREDFARRRVDEGRLVESLACVREIARRSVGQKADADQLIAVLAIYHGQFVELKEAAAGTLVAALAAVWAAWSNPSAHLVTAGDEQAARHARSMGPFFRCAGLTCAAVGPADAPAQRLDAYRHAVVYVPYRELISDWLRDQVRLGATRHAAADRLAPPDDSLGRSGVLVPGLHAAIVEDADMVLIDHASSALTLSSVRQVHAAPQVFRLAADAAGHLVSGRDFTVDGARRRVNLTEEGRRRLADSVRDTDPGSWQAARRRREFVEQALSALHCYERGRHYEVVEERVVVVDETTGRQMPHRHWARGLHQAIEAREAVEITGEGRVLAGINLPHFFGQYRAMSGLTASIRGVRGELERTYGAVVRALPAREGKNRKLLSKKVFTTSDAHRRALVDRVVRSHRSGRPVVIAVSTTSFCEQLRELLTCEGIEVGVVNAVHPEHDAQVLSRAGRSGSVTVAVNLAGRCTALDGDAGERGLDLIVAQLQGSRRMDKRLAGLLAGSGGGLGGGIRGDSGGQTRGQSGEFGCVGGIFVSLDDPLFAIHAPFVVNWTRRLYAGRSDQVLRMWSGAIIRTVQRRAEVQARVARSALLRRDDWLDRALPSR